MKPTTQQATEYAVRFTIAEWDAIKDMLIARDTPWHDYAAESIQRQLTPQQ